MDTLLNILPNLSIGVVCVLSLVYITLKFLQELKRGREAQSAVEKEMRIVLTDIVSKSTAALDNNSRVLGRVITMLDNRHTK